MADTVTFEEVAALAAQLSQQDRQRLVDALSKRKDAEPGEPRPRWTDLRGIAPNLLDGEDAQAWVSRNRRESDEHREKQLRRGP